MTLAGLLLLTAVTIAVYMLMFWLASLPLHNASIVDIGWGLGFVIVAWQAFLLVPSTSPQAVLLVLLVTIWGFRLSVYLAWRNVGHSEDRRYAKMRQAHGPRFWWVSLLTVFALQGVVMWVVALPVVVGIYHAQAAPALPFTAIAGAVVWLVGLAFEAIGDWQLARFLASRAGDDQVMDRGLWRYTRHPNYFGDFLVWWGHWLVSLGPWWTIVGPLVMSTLLMRFSGVSLLESDITDRRPAYAAYKRRTSAFFPWRPRVESRSGEHAAD